MPESRDSLCSRFGARVAQFCRKRRATRTSRNREAGQVIALTAVSLFVLLLAAGLAIDTGFLRLQRRRIQGAADSAAIAGADEINYGDVQSAATADAAANGFGASAQVTAQCGTSLTGGFGGCNSGTPYVQVSVAQQEPLFFMKIIPGITSPTISAVATAYYGSGVNCMYALQMDAPGGSISGSTISTTVQTNCAILSNGTISVPNCVGEFQATAIGYHGTAPVIGCGATTDPIAVPATDPLAFISPPDPPGTCIGAPTPITSNMSPGDYPCGIDIEGQAVTFAPGTYIIGNGLTIEGNGAMITGQGVTFYIASGQVHICASATLDPGATGCPQYSINSINLTASTTGPYAGILFYQDRSDSLAANIVGNDVNGVSGVGSTTLEGIFYFPNSQLTFAEVTNQNPTWQQSYSAIVADTLKLMGTVRFGDDYSSLPNGSPIKDAVLVQ